MKCNLSQGWFNQRKAGGEAVGFPVQHLGQRSRNIQLCIQEEDQGHTELLFCFKQGLFSRLHLFLI